MKATREFAVILVVILIGGAFGYEYLQVLNQVASLENTDSRLERNLSNATSVLASINSRLISMDKQQNATFTSLIHNQTAMVATLRQENNTLTGEIQNERSTIASLTEQLGKLAAGDAQAIANLQQQIATASGQIASLQQQVAATNAEISTLLQHIQELEKAISRLPAVPSPVSLPIGISHLGLAAPQEREVFAALGLYWVIYSDGSNIDFQTSHDGISWSMQTVLRSATTTSSFSLWHDTDTDTIYYVVADGKTAGFWYRSGIATASGEITWSAVEIFVGTTGPNATNPYIYGTPASVWVSLGTAGGANIEVWKHDTSGWTKVNQIRSDSGNMSIVLPLTIGMALLYQNRSSNVPSPVFITVTSDGGRDWSSPRTSSTAYTEVSAISRGNLVAYVGIDSSSRLYLEDYFLAEPQSVGFGLGLIATGVQRAAITSDIGLHYVQMAVIYSNSPSAIKYALGITNQTGSSIGVSMKNFAGTIAENETGIGPTISIEAISVGGVVPLIWTAGPNTNVLRFATVVLSAGG